MIMTIEDDDDDINTPVDESDDDDFAMGSAAAVGATLADGQESLGWQMTDGRDKGLRLTSRGSTLDAKLKQRATRPATLDQRSATLVEQQPASSAEDAATELAESRTGKVAREKRAKLHKEQQQQQASADAGPSGDAEFETAEDEDDDAEAEAVARGRKSAIAATFEELQLSKPLIKAVGQLGFTRPTPIQAAVIPHALKGVDLCASAQTGSGKTAAFMLPILERLLYRPRRIAATRVLVMLPTRELAAQVEAMGKALSRFSDVRMALVVGGLSSKVQETELRTRPDIVLATPGRLIDLLRNALAVSLDELEILVLDEADRLLELGFKDEVEEVLKLCPKKRQTMFFSATISESVAALANLSLNKPVQVKVDSLYKTNTRLLQEFVRLKPKHEHEREATLLSLASRTFTERVIVFFASKKSAHRAKLLFGLAGLRAAELHGNLTQQQRLQSLEDFRDGKCEYLLATDLAGRGLDISGVKTVINNDLPTEMKTYVHRVGRTARAGKEGRAVSIVAEKDRAFLKQVLKHAAQDSVQTRTVPAASVSYWTERVGELEGEIQELMLEEVEDKQLRLAEMEASKATNLVNHHDEIMARPPKTWFQTETQKQQAKEASKYGDATAQFAAPVKAEEPKVKVKRDKFAGLTRKQKRRLQHEALFADDGDEEGGGGGGGGGSKAPNQKAAAKSFKSKERGLAGTGVNMAQGIKRKLLGEEHPGAANMAAKKAKAAAKEPKAPKEAPKEKHRAPKKMRSHSKPKYSKARKR